MLGVNDKNAIVDRLMEIVTAESATVQTKNGPVQDEVTADRNSLTATKSLGGLHLKFLKNRTGTAGSCASHDGFKIGTSFARCEAEGAGVMLNVKDQKAMLDRLMQIVSKQTVTVQTKNGPVEDEVTADKNSIAAAKFMIGIQAKYLKLDEEDADIVRLNENDQKAIVVRLMQILSKRSVIVQTKNGPVDDHVIADKNAITSANLLMSGIAGWCSGTAGSCASDASESRRAGERSKIGKSFARGAGTAGSRAPHVALKIGKSFARYEPDEAPSDADFTVQDVIEEAIRSAGGGGKKALACG